MSVVTKDVTFDVGAVTLSGLLAAPDRPRATILALPGGGYRAAYWTGHVEPRHSLLTLGAQQGFAVLALDRPGYGASYGLAKAEQDVAHQSVLLHEFLRGLSGRFRTGGPIFVVGHSLGAIVTLQLAADNPDRGPISAVAVSGLPVEYPDWMQQNMAALPADLEHLPPNSTEALRAMFYGPDGTWEPAALDEDAATQAPVPAAEFADAFGYPATFGRIAPRVRVPVQYALAEFEASSVGGAQVLARSAAAFTAAPRVEAFLQAGAGHSIGMHRVAGAYHLRVLAFFEESLALASSQ